MANIFHVEVNPVTRKVDLGRINGTIFLKTYLMVSYKLIKDSEVISESGTLKSLMIAISVGAA